MMRFTLIIKKSIALTFLIFLFSEALSQGSDSVKCWNVHNKLIWSDFKDSPPLVGDNSSYNAVCTSTVVVYPVMEADGKYKYKVKAIFFRYKSWSRDTTKFVLGHEQLHFDITELYARKLRKKIKEFKGEYDSAFGSMVTNLITEMATQGEVYDQDTIHGAYKEGQEKWAKKICEELKQLKEFASTPEDCDQKK